MSRRAGYIVLALAVIITGCSSAKDEAELREAQRHFQDTANSSLDGLQWRLDQATAAKLFDNGTQAGIDRYLTFRKCHEEPPKHDKNKRLCEELQKRVAGAEAKAALATARAKATW